MKKIVAVILQCFKSQSDFYDIQLTSAKLHNSAEITLISHDGIYEITIKKVR